MKINNSTVLNKLQSYSRISALDPEGHCTSRFKRAVYFMSTACGRPQGGLAHVVACGHGEGSQRFNFSL